MTSAGALLNIDLSAVRENYRRLCAKASGAKVAAVVKSDAYGLGADKVATQLLQDKCDTFFVAHLSEAIKLRAALGPSPEILVLNGIPEGYAADFTASNLTPVINSLSDLEQWQSLSRKLEKPLGAALQVDSGMSRLGLCTKDVQKIQNSPDMLDGVDISLVMSHLACAGDPSHPSNAEQREAFETLSDMLPAAKRSLANSSGIFLDNQLHYNLVRPGAALYGINPISYTENPMLPVVQLQARVLEIREIPAGTHVGYDYLYKASNPRRLATLSIGYADGWHRQWTVGASYNGMSLPLIGRISMDSMVIDITDLPEAQLSRNMFVDLINKTQTLDIVANVAQTIGYEVLTSIGERVERRYNNLTGT